MFAVIFVTVLSSVVQVYSYSEQASNILLSGICSPYLARIQYFLLRIIIDFDCIRPQQPVTTVYEDNFVWKDDSHMSNNRTLILSLLQNVTDYLSRIHMKVHFGDNHLSTDLNSQLLFTQDDCYMVNMDDCNQAQPNRIFQIHPPIYGFSLLYNRMRAYIQQLNHMDADLLNETIEELRFIQSSIRYDISQGMDSLMNTLTDIGTMQISQSQAILIVITIIFNLIIILILVIVTIPWAMHFKQISDYTHTLLSLVPLEALDNDVSFLPSMNTNNQEIDDLRKKILHFTNDLIESINQPHNFGNQVGDAINDLIQICVHTFESEEKQINMLKNNKSKFDKHIIDHKLILHRLLFLQEQLKELILDESQLERTSNVFKRTMAYVMNIGGSAKLLNKIEAMKFIISRTVANVFNNHFIEMDPEFSEEIGLIVRGKMDQDQEIKEDNSEQNEQQQQ
ncbi:MAG: hypothetical protein EZS28_000229 [Streblomastix strix]|uniref:Uncharacterized protein n=1 Tax=Streblomastix strix TaxID=222440 RepID=A0A5J4XBE2_9EUKA|nr:MAG: hypothetical protein EZS28_000229 [Streblomastix strix]